MSKYQDSLPEDALFGKVTRTIARPIATTFRYIVPVDVTHIFPRRGDMPGNVKTTVTSEWGKRVGQTRDTTADDGSSFHETLTDLEENKSFSCKVENLTSPAMRVSWNGSREHVNFPTMETERQALNGFTF